MREVYSEQGVLNQRTQELCNASCVLFSGISEEVSSRCSVKNVFLEIALRTK